LVGGCPVLPTVKAASFWGCIRLAESKSRERNSQSDCDRMTNRYCVKYNRISDAAVFMPETTSGGQLMRNRITLFGWCESSIAFRQFGFSTVIHCDPKRPMISLSGNKQCILWIAFRVAADLVLANGRIPISINSAIFMRNYVAFANSRCHPL
jgi:hypothetical protein